MSSELHKYIETAIEQKESILNAEVIDFPNEKKVNEITDLKINTFEFWKISDETNNDQLKAVTGICLVFGILIIMGLYSYLI